MRKAVCLAVLLALGCSVFPGRETDVIGDIRASVKSGWRKMADRSGEILEMREKMKTLPERSWLPFAPDRQGQQAKIRERLKDVRKLLLSTTAQELMAEVDGIDRDLAKTSRGILEATETRTLNPDEAQACDRKLAELRARKASLEERRRTRAARVCAELRALGLNVSGDAAENCLFTVNFDDLIDGAVVSRNIAVVVENLRELMATGDVAAARRYYGMYLVMVDVQVASFEDYLEKSRHGAWREGVNRIRDEAAAVRDRALASSRDAALDAAQRAIFARNAEVNSATVRAAEAYLGVLDAHEGAIERKLEAARSVKAVVENSYDTVNLAGEFLDLAKSSQSAFDTLLTLDLPPVQVFDDAAVQQEFLAITRKLKE